MSIISRSRPRASDPAEFDTASTVLADSAAFDPMGAWNLPYGGDGLLLHTRRENLPDRSASGQHGDGSASADTDGEFSPPPARRRRLAVLPPPGGPLLGPIMAPAINALFRELTAETNGRERFVMATPEDIHLAVETFARYRLTSLAFVRQTDASSRRMLLADMVELGRLAFPEMQMAAQMLSHFSPQLAIQRTSSKDPMFGEIVLPERLRAYAANLSILGALLKPNQPMSNYVSRELALGDLQIPSYTPYIAPDLSGSPWCVPIAEHSAALTRWRVSRQAAKMHKNLQLPFTDCVLYRMRFIFAADICGDWPSFGGISAHLNGLSAALNIAATDNFQTDLLYDSLLPNRLEELARSRAERVSGATDFAPSSRMNSFASRLRPLLRPLGLLLRRNRRVMRFRMIRRRCNHGCRVRCTWLSWSGIAVRNRPCPL